MYKRAIVSLLVFVLVFSVCSLIFPRDAYADGENMWTFKTGGGYGWRWGRLITTLELHKNGTITSEFDGTYDASIEGEPAITSLTFVDGAVTIECEQLVTTEIIGIPGDAEMVVSSSYRRGDPDQVLYDNYELQSQSMTSLHRVIFTNPAENAYGEAMPAYMAFKLVSESTGQIWTGHSAGQRYGGMPFYDGITAVADPWSVGDDICYNRELDKYLTVYYLGAGETINFWLPTGVTVAPLGEYFFAYESVKRYFSEYLHIVGQKNLNGGNISYGDFEFDVQIYSQATDTGIDLGYDSRLVPVRDGGSIDFGRWSFEDVVPRSEFEPLYFWVDIKEDPADPTMYDYDEKTVRLKITVDSGGAYRPQFYVTNVEYFDVDEGGNTTPTTGIFFNNTKKGGGQNHKLTIRKEVSGALGDKNKKFSFSVDTGSGTPTTFDLAHGEEMEIDGIASGTSVTIQEIDSQEGYLTSYKVGGATAFTAGNTATLTVDADTRVTFNNELEPAVPTAVPGRGRLPGILLILLAAPILLFRRKKRAIGR